MSILTNAMARGLNAVANARGEALYYRTAIGTGSWVLLTGFVLDRDEVVPPQFSDRQEAEETLQTARLSGPLSPAMAVGYGIKDGSANEWAVETAELDGQQLCTCRRITVANAGPDRGGAS